MVTYGSGSVRLDFLWNLYGDLDLSQEGYSSEKRLHVVRYDVEYDDSYKKQQKQMLKKKKK